MIVQKLKPALKLHCDLRKMDSSVLEGDYISRLFNSCKRLAEITALVGKTVTPFVHRPVLLNAMAFRSIFRGMIFFAVIR